MFAFSQIQPETRTQVTDMEVPMSKYLRASASQGWHDSIYMGWWRLNERWAEERDTDYPMLTVEEANKNYGTETLKFDAPVRENIAMMLQTQHQEQAARNFLLTNDNHSIVAAGLGMSTTMLASMLNPVDLALMFVPVVGQETKLAAGASALGRGRAALRTGLITRETLQFLVPKAPRLAESVIQGGAYMVAYEALNQPLAMLEKRDPGNPIINIAAGTAMAAAFHGVVTAISHLLFRLPPDVQQAMANKAADDFAKGKPIDVTEIIKTTETVAKEQVAAAEVSSVVEPTKPFDFKTFEEKVKGIFRTKLNELRQDILPGKSKPVVPETSVEYEKTAFSSVFDEIRQRGLRTKEQIQKAFPEANLSREEAAVLRREAWGEEQIKKQQADNLLEIIEKVKNRELPERKMGLKRQARLEAERNMPNPFKDDAEINGRIPNKALPDEKAIAVIEEDAKLLEQKLAIQQEAPITPESIGLIPQKGKLGKQGWYTVKDTNIDVSVYIDPKKPDEIHLINIRSKEKGAGGKFLEQLKILADKTNKPISLLAHADSPTLQPKLEAFYEKHGFVRDVDNGFVYTPGQAKEAPMSKGAKIAEELKEYKARYDGVQTWIAEQPKDVYTSLDKKNPFTVYVDEGAPKSVVEEAFKKKVAENTPMPKAIETAVECVTKNLL